MRGGCDPASRTVGLPWHVHGRSLHGLLLLLSFSFPKHKQEHGFDNTNNHENQPNPDEEVHPAADNSRSYGNKQTNTNPNPPRNLCHYPNVLNPVYFCNIFGTSTLPSFLWKFSKIAANAREVATQVLFKVCAYCLSLPKYLIFERTA